MRLSLLLVLAMACTGGPVTDTAAQVVVEGPILVHEPPTTQLVQGVPVTLQVSATDPDGVRSVSGWYRRAGDVVWQNLPLVSEGDGQFSATIDGAAVQAPSLEYYFRAVDASAAQAATYLPRQGFDIPFRVDVQRVGEPLPFVEDFEGAGSSLFSLGWVAYSQAFAAFGWQWTTARFHGGSHGVTHPRGTVDAAVLDDWLVSPALDLSSLENIEVSWWELGDYAENARHSLWISTGSADPSDGDYEFVQDLGPAPEDSWGRAQVVDLSAWSGARAATLAWRYEGQFADAWTLDDVRVQQLHPDLHLQALSWTPASPGAATTLTVELTNRTAATADELVLSGEVDPAKASFAGPVDLGALNGMSSVASDLTLLIDPAHPNNARLPFTVVATTADSVWTWDRELVVGQASSATVGLNLVAPTVLSAAFVVGDPSSPSLTVPVAAGSFASGAHQLEVDLTDVGAWLPPEPGPRRWWLRVDAQGNGEVTGWGLSYDGSDYTALEKGPFGRNNTAWFALPRPPRPRVQQLVTTPVVVGPGDAVTAELTLQNDGAATVGRTTLAVRSLDPSVQITDGALVELTPTSWGAGHPVTVPLQLQVDASKVDSQPALVELVVADEVESTRLEARIDVPWPVLAVTGVTVLSDTSGDGVLDPTEQARLRVQISNRGSLATASSLSCTLSDAGGPATVEFPQSSASYGKLDAGETDRDSGYQVQVVSGAPGDVVSVAMSCSENAGSHTYEASFEVVLGERPWTSLEPLGDPIGDVKAGYGFDFDGGSYRTDGQRLQVRLHSAVPVDPGTLFLEAWGQSLGAGYDQFQLVSQSGVASLRGLDSVFGTATLLTPPAVRMIDPQTVELELDLSSMDLLLSSLQIGFAAGFCGVDGYYCDQFPDGWGDPHQAGLQPDAWVELRW